jgi:hypothetical protein
MSNQHPITPSPELIQKWCGGSVQQWWKDTNGDIHEFLILATQAAQWGADQELEATLGLMETLNIRGVDYIRNVRRPKPPSLKERALAELDRIPTHDNEGLTWGVDIFIIRKALEALPND